MKLFLRINYPHSTDNDKKESFGINSANIQLLINMIKYSKDVVQLVDTEVINPIADLINKGITRVGDITKALDHEVQIPAQKTLFQIMIMLKYGVFAPAI